MISFSSRYPIAIDLSDGAELCALQLDEGRGTPVIRAAARRDWDGGESVPWDKAVVSFVRDTLRNRRFQGRAVALLPPKGVVRSYPLRVEVGKEESFEAALVRMAGNVMDLPLEEMLLDYASVLPESAPSRNTYNVFLVATRKEDALHYLDLVRQAGGALELIEFAASALMRAHALAGARSNPVLLCKVGRTQTTLVVATRNTMLAHRSLEWGAERMSRVLVDNLSLGGQARDADFLLRKHGLLHPARSEEAPLPPADEDDMSQTVGQLLVPLADELLNELHNIMAYVRSGSHNVVFDGLFLYGQGTRVAGLAPYLTRELTLEAREMNPLEKMGVRNIHALSGIGDGSNMALTLGLAMRRVRWL